MQVQLIQCRRKTSQGSAVAQEYVHPIDCCRDHEHLQFDGQREEQATADAKRKLALQPIGSGLVIFRCTPCPSTSLSSNERSVIYS
jgi:hypothetical protein